MVKNRLFFRICFAVMSCVFFVGSVSAAIYKTVDEHGNVVFTDSAPMGQPSEEVKLKPITRIEAPLSSRTTSAQEPDAEKVVGYDSIDIAEPSPGTTIRNQNSFKIRLAVSPGIQPGHSVRLLLNGKKIGESTGQLSFTATNVARGSQVLTAQILDGNKKVIKSTKSTVYVHLASVN